MADSLSPQVSDRICKHMNDDHADAIVLYAQVFGGLSGVTAAQMERIDPTGMDLAVEVAGTSQSLRIPFDHELQDSEDAHQTLIAMVRQARSGAQSEAQ
jgi:putative heme iron utilization protein